MIKGLGSQLFPLPANHLQKHNASLPVQKGIYSRNWDTHKAFLIKKWRWGVSNTTYSHTKYISHVRVTAANISPQCSCHRWSQSPAGHESWSDESFRWIISEVPLVGDKAAMGGSQGSGYGRREAWSVMSLMGAQFMYTDRLLLSASQETLSTTASVPGELGVREVYLYKCVYAWLRCVWLHVCNCPFIEEIKKKGREEGENIKCSVFLSK